MEVLNVESYFVVLFIGQCVFMGISIYVFMIEQMKLEIQRRHQVLRDLSERITRCMESILLVNSLIMCLFSVLVFVLYISTLLCYMSQYIPLSSMYLLWKLDHPEYRI